MTDNPELQSILASLTRFANPAPHVPPVPNDASQVGAPGSHGNGVGLSTGMVVGRPEDPRLRPQSRSAATASPKPVIDPATITTWQDGLRCVTKVAAQNAQFPATIRKVCLSFLILPSTC